MLTFPTFNALSTATPLLKSTTYTNNDSALASNLDAMENDLYTMFSLSVLWVLLDLSQICGACFVLGMVKGWDLDDKND